MKLVSALLAVAAVALANEDPTHGVSRTIRCGGAAALPVRIDCDDVTYSPDRDHFSRPRVYVVVEYPDGSGVGFARFKGRVRRTRDGATRYSASNLRGFFRARFDGDALMRMRLSARPPRALDPEPPFNARLRLTEADVTGVEVIWAQ